jgi:hypothetical protein
MAAKRKRDFVRGFAGKEGKRSEQDFKISSPELNRV